MQDVAVKVLTVQDFHDDQLKEFLREVLNVNFILSNLLSESSFLENFDEVHIIDFL